MGLDGIQHVERAAVTAQAVVCYKPGENALAMKLYESQRPSRRPLCLVDDHDASVPSCSQHAEAMLFPTVMANPKAFLF